MAKKKTLKERATQKKRTPSKLQFVKMASGGYRDKNSGKVYTDLEGAELLMQNKATLSKWKGGKKVNKESYEGTQYTGGRVKGRKNLVKTDSGGFVNEHGVEFTLKERKALENAVNRANKTRTQMLKAEAELPRMSGGKNTGQKVKNLQAMGKESDFIISRRSKSLHQFKSKADYEYYMKDLERVNSKNYLDDRIELYKNNHIKAIENVFGSDAEDVVEKIKNMKNKDYMQLIQQDEDLEVSYVYDPSALAGKLNTIRKALGIDMEEEPT